MWMNKTADSSAVRLLPGQLTASLKVGLALPKACRLSWNDPRLRKSVKQARRDCHPAVPGNLSTKAWARNREPAHRSVSVSTFVERALFRPRRVGHARRPCAPALGGLTLLKLEFSSRDRPRFAAGGESCRPEGLTRAPRGRPGRGDSRGVVTFPLPEAGSRPTRTAAHAPGAPRAPVPVHVLRDGGLAHTLSRAAPLKHSRPFHVKK